MSYDVNLNYYKLMAHLKSMNEIDQNSIKIDRDGVGINTDLEQTRFYKI